MATLISDFSSQPQDYGKRTIALHDVPVYFPTYAATTELYCLVTEAHVCVSGLPVVLPVFISRGTRGNAAFIVEVFQNALWTALRTVFRPQMH